MGNAPPECGCCGDTLPSEDRQYCSRECVRKDGGRVGVRYAWTESYHPAWSLSTSHSNTTVTVHQLLAVADGADPYKVYGNSNYSVDHINGCPLDNRPENIQVLTVEEHGRKDATRNANKYTHGDMLRLFEDIASGTEYSAQELIERTDKW
jgi:hypothetical protein